ncbi:membrane bound O-acyl transferase family-domain-containing protein [Lentinula edodes]|uniref:Membrane bound O-acyl transferase family-domain-containing protein n=1 Tax=Lentinula lateritia TaxID=40482 RepID=A0A9W8ZWR8_9AGAR|nr:membrane bound O-acyl transferase family-domain-containing protein [Lentinula edodes]
MDQQISPTPSFIIPLSLIIFTLGLTFQSRSIRISFFIALLSTSYLTIFRSSTGIPPLNYAYATALGCLTFQAFDFLVLTNPHSELHLVGDEKNISEKPFSTRFLWAWKLVLSPRGIGWSHEPKDILPPHPKAQSRVSFISSQFLSTIPWIFIGDAANLALRNHPGFQLNGPSISNVGPFMRILNVWIFALPGAATLQLQYKMFSIIATAAGFYRPEDWPELFGKWSDAYTIRRFWGRTWHQIMRRWVSAPGNIVAQRFLNLKQGTKISAYTKLFVAFLISGTIHQMCDYSLQHRDFWAGGSFTFFLSQAVMIILEDSFIAAGERLGIQAGSYVRILGYIWTLVWFAIALPIWLDPYFHDGMATSEGLSVIGALWKRDWTGSSVNLSLPLSY